MTNMTRALTQWCSEVPLLSTKKKLIDIYSAEWSTVLFSGGYHRRTCKTGSKHANICIFLETTLQLLSQKCQLLHFAQLKTVLLKEFQDELSKILEVCSNEKIVLIWIHMTQHVMWSCIIRYQVSHAKNYAKIDFEITLFLRQITSLLSNFPDLNIQWKVLLVIMMLTSLTNL